LTWRMSSLRVFSTKLRTIMSSVMRGRRRLMGLSGLLDWSRNRATHKIISRSPILQSDP
jgi:hypothetical protein